jgi:probable rRNA maturation factor
VAIDVFAADEQRDRPVDLARWVALARDVLESMGVRGDAEVSVFFVDEAAIASLNEQFLGKDGPTDVLAFPLEDDPVPGGRSPDLGGTGPGTEPEDEPLVLLGDVVICPEVAAANAAAHGVTETDETALLVVHGLLHLLGLDHQVDAEAERMEGLERELLARFHPSGSPR